MTDHETANDHTSPAPIPHDLPAGTFGITVPVDGYEPTPEPIADGAIAVDAHGMKWLRARDFLFGAHWLGISYQWQGRKKWHQLDGPRVSDGGAA